MKVYISVDMEGVACVTHHDQVKPGSPEYEMARKWMTGEANAAVEGTLEAGATEVVVADSHAHMHNILPDELHEEALLVRGSVRPLGMMEGLDETSDVTILVGYHSMAGTAQGVLSHTYHSRWVYALRLNGITVGEAGFNGALAGHFGTPVALVCGDDTLDTEVGALMPWAERVITKWALSSVAARSLTPEVSRTRIREGARRALGRLHEMKPLVLKRPICLEVDFMNPICAHLAADIPGVERVNGRTIAYTGSDMLEIARCWRLIINASLGEVSGWHPS